MSILDRFRKKNAFSTAEMLLVLLIVSFLILAIPPLMHKKVEKLTKRGFHGRYECFKALDSRGNVRLYEYLATEKEGIIIGHMGKASNDENPNRAYPEDITEKKQYCTFDPQKYAKDASYFSIQAIGGGAGGTYAPYEAPPADSGVNEYGGTPKENDLIWYGVRPVKSDCSNNLKLTTSKNSTTGAILGWYYDCSNKALDNYTKYTIKPVLDKYHKNPETQWVYNYFPPLLSVADVTICSGMGHRGEGHFNNNLNSVTSDTTTLSLSNGQFGQQGLCFKFPHGSFVLGRDEADYFMVAANQSYSYGFYDKSYAKPAKSHLEVSQRYSKLFVPFNYKQPLVQDNFSFSYPNPVNADESDISGKFYRRFIPTNSTGKNDAATFEFSPFYYDENVDGSVFLHAIQNSYKNDTMFDDKPTKLLSYDNYYLIAANYSDVDELPVPAVEVYSRRYYKDNGAETYRTGDYSNNNFTIRGGATGRQGQSKCTAEGCYDDASANDLYADSIFTRLELPDIMNGCFYKNYDNEKCSYVSRNDEEAKVITEYDSKKYVYKSFAGIQSAYKYAPFFYSSEDNYAHAFNYLVRLKYKATKKSTTYGYAGQTGKFINYFLPKFNGVLEIMPGEGGDAGTKDSSTPDNIIGKNGGATVIWSRSHTQQSGCDSNSAGCKQILNVKGGMGVKGTAIGYTLVMRGINTGKGVVPNLHGCRIIHGCLDAGAADAPLRFAQRSQFVVLPEFDKKTKTPSALSSFFSGDIVPGSGGDGGYSYIYDNSGDETLINYSTYESNINRFLKYAHNNFSPVSLKSIGAGNWNLPNGGRCFDVYNGWKTCNKLVRGNDSAITDADDYKCFTRDDVNNNKTVGSGDDVDPENEIASAKVRICKPRKGLPGAVVIVW